MKRFGPSIRGKLKAQRKKNGCIRIHYGIMRGPKWTGALIAFLISFFSFANKAPGVALPFLILGLYLISNDGGIEIDTRRNRYRRFRSYFWKRTGKWHSFEPIQAILMLPGIGSKVVPGPHFSFPLKFTGRFYDVHLTNKAHRKKIFLKSFDHRGNANEYANGMSEELGLPIEKYRPKVSERTKRRRRRRKRRRRK